MQPRCCGSPQPEPAFCRTRYISPLPFGLQVSVPKRSDTNISQRWSRGVGQKSLRPELTGTFRFSGSLNDAYLFSRSETQMSFRGTPSSWVCSLGRFEAMKRLSPSRDSIGQPSAAILSLTSITGLAAFQPEKRCLEEEPAIALEAKTSRVKPARAGIASEACWGGLFFMAFSRMVRMVSKGPVDA